MDLASERILRRGGERNVSASDRTTYPLHDAAREGRSRVVRLLLDHGHSALTLDDEGIRASEWAREAGHIAIADELEERESVEASVPSMPRREERLSIKELIELIQGKPDAVGALISSERIHAIDGKGDTPLHICAAQGRLQFCDLLIKAGADPAAMNFEHKKPHDRAAENGHEIVAGLLRSLLPVSDARSDLYPVPRVDPAKTGSAEPERKQEDDDEVFNFDDFDLDFNGEEEAEDFHGYIERDDYVASFEVVDERVTRLGDEDGADLDFDGLEGRRFGIGGDDIIEPLPQTAEYADAATFRSFNDVRSGPRIVGHVPARITRFHAIDEGKLLQWVENVVGAGVCSGEDIDALIMEIRGSFDAKGIRGNLIYEMTNLGLMDGEDEAFVADDIPDPEDIADLLFCICNGLNMRPGMEFRPLSARAESHLFRELAASQRQICRTLVSDALLVSVVVMLGERLQEGSTDPGLLTELDIKHGRQTPDSGVLEAALSYLVGYQTLLDEGDVSRKDRASALEAVAAMKLSRLAIELIAKGVEANPELEDLRKEINTSLAAWERYRQKILLEHMPLVRRQASRRRTYVDSIEDLVQDGVFGLMRSIDLFDPHRGYRFMTYCQFAVRQSISRAQDDTASLVRVPSHRAMVLRKVDRLEDGMSEQFPAETVISWISEKLNIPTEDIRKMRRIPRRPVPFGEMSTDCVDVEAPQFWDYVALERAAIIEGFLAAMPERAADIVARRFGLRGEDEMTLEELGAIYGVTRERIRQIEAKHLAKIGHSSHQRLLRSML